MLDETLKSKNGIDISRFQKLFNIEDRHFWFRSRNRVIAEALRNIQGDLPQEYLALELGCETGNPLRVLKHICARGLVVGMDFFIEGLRSARCDPADQRPV